MSGPNNLRNYNAACPVETKDKSPSRRYTRLALTERFYRESVERYRSATDLNYFQLYGWRSRRRHWHAEPAASDEPPIASASPRRRKHDASNICFIVVDASTRIGGGISQTEAAPDAKEIVRQRDRRTDQHSKPAEL